MDAINISQEGEVCLRTLKTSYRRATLCDEKTVPRLPCNCFACQNKMGPSHLAYKLQTKRQIDNELGVSASLYLNTLSAITVAKQNPWTMHIQPTLVGGGSSYHGSSVRRTNTGVRPGAQCPGGVGVEVKHDSYARYMNRIQGKTILGRKCCR